MHALLSAPCPQPLLVDVYPCCIATCCVDRPGVWCIFPPLVQGVAGVGTARDVGRAARQALHTQRRNTGAAAGRGHTCHFILIILCIIILHIIIINIILFNN